ncbi:D-alanyl-D-alanine carboxypeptidase family protein [Uniformispora flossi]|uniref:D-alanyl-D-alanine carboxypeptidase family protein n=1 Tax=Uniformispora flossi TaxID=3390723 RepID=UPI003C2FC8D2
MNQIPEDRRGADDPAGAGVPRHRVDSRAPGYPQAAYSDAAQYLDNAWRESSGQGPAVNPHEIPTQVVPVQSAPVQTAQSAPVPPAAAQPSPAPAAPGPGAAAGAGAETVAQPFPPADPRSAPAAHPAAAGVPGPRGAADANPVDLGAYAMSPAAAAGGGAPSGPGAFPAAPEADRPRGRRKMIAVWSVVSAVALVGAGLVAVKSMKSDKDHNSASSASPTATIQAAPPSAPATSAGPTSAPPSTSPTASTTGKSTKSPTATSTTKKPKTGTDDDGDGITDDPGATDPNQLSGAARTAYQQAKTAMAANGITLTLTSGKRSFQHQQDLWDQEVRDTGSTAAARNRVLPPGESSHVQGIAIDINVAAQAWMKSKGSQYGWCQIYANEAWHFEYRASYKTSGCPTLKPHP